MKKVLLKDGYYWKSFKIKLYPTEEQKQYFDRCIELSRFVYNWALSLQLDKFEKYKNGESEKSTYSVIELNKMFSDFRNNPNNEWVRTLTITGARYQILNLDRSYERFFDKSLKNRCPKFKSKKHSKNGFFCLRPDRTHFYNNKLKIDGIKSLIETKFYSNWNYSYIPERSTCPFMYEAKIHRSYIGEYFLSFSTQVPKIKRPIVFLDDKYVIGIDLNIKDRFVCSNGYRSGSPDLAKKKNNLSEKTRKLHKDLDRKSKWEKTNPDSDYIESNRAKRRYKQFIRASQKIVNTVENFIQTETSKIIKMNPRAICMETVGVSDMLQNHYTTSSELQHANFYRCRIVMQKKCEKRNIPFILADRHFPSSQLCSRCGERYKIKSEKIYKCKYCGLTIDRDENAAINLQKYALLSFINN